MLSHSRARQFCAVPCRYSHEAVRSVRNSSSQRSAVDHGGAAHPVEALVAAVVVGAGVPEVEQPGHGVDRGARQECSRSSPQGWDVEHLVAGGGGRVRGVHIGGGDGPGQRETERRQPPRRRERGARSSVDARAASSPSRPPGDPIRERLGRVAIELALIRVGVTPFIRIVLTVRPRRGRDRYPTARRSRSAGCPSRRRPARCRRRPDGTCGPGSAAGAAYRQRCACVQSGVGPQAQQAAECVEHGDDGVVRGTRRTGARRRPRCARPAPAHRRPAGRRRRRRARARGGR